MFQQSIYQRFVFGTFEGERQHPRDVNQHHMQISEKTCKIAISKSLNNAKELIIDAKILEENNRILRSYTLYHFAMEELSKASKCLLILFSKDFNNSKTLKELEQLFKNHKLKLKQSAAIDLWLINIFIEENPPMAIKLFRDFITYTKDAHLFDKLKNYSIYTQYLNNTFKNPNEFIHKKHVDHVKFLAEIRLKILTDIWSFTQRYYDQITEINFSSIELNEDEGIKSSIQKLFK